MENTENKLFAFVHFIFSILIKTIENVEKKMKRKKMSQAEKKTIIFITFTILFPLLFAYYKSVIQHFCTIER